MSSTSEFPVPRPTPESAPFWEACRTRQWILPFCDTCQRYWFPPGVFCPECWGMHWRWRGASGAGTVHSFVVFRRQYHPAFPPPYAVGVIALDEGPHILSQLVDAPETAWRVGMPVRVTWRTVGEWVLPCFRPVNE